MAKETVLTVLTRFRVSVPLDTAVVEHSNAITATARRRPPFVTELMTVVTVLTKGTAHCRVLK